MLMYNLFDGYCVLVLIFYDVYFWFGLFEVGEMFVVWLLIVNLGLIWVGEVCFMMFLLCIFVVFGDGVMFFFGIDLMFDVVMEVFDVGCD